MIYVSIWSLFKRAIHSTYVSIDPFHIRRYLDEESFCFNERHDGDSSRFVTVPKGVIDKRLTYSELTGKRLTLS